MKDYYQILGVSRYAGTAEIKRAFRRMANLYHPDRNPSPEAEAIIKEVIEAYEVLDDPALRAQYDNLLLGIPAEPEPEPTTPRHRDPAYHRRRTPNPNYKSPKQKTIEMMESLLPYCLYISWTTLAFCLFLMIDFGLPAVQQTETILHRMQYASRYGRNRAIESSNVFVTDQGNEIKVAGDMAGSISNGLSITTAYSRILRVPRSFKNNETQQVVRVPATIYGNFLFAPFFLLAFSITGVSWRKGIVFRFNVGIVNFFLLLLNILFLFVHHLHLR